MNALALPHVELGDDMCNANTLRADAAAPEVCGKTAAEIAADAQAVAGTVAGTVLGLTDTSS